MAVDRKYGKVSIKGIPADEPVFILRAQDALAIQTIARYQTFAHALDGTSARAPEFVSSLDEVMADFRSWQSDNPDALKLPD
jgi:hypothetical protein